MPSVLRRLPLAAVAVMLIFVFSSPLDAQSRPALDVDARLARDSFTLQSQPFPSWKVELTYTNRSKEPIELDDTIVLITSASATKKDVGIHFTRKKAGTDDIEGRINDRYGLVWGIDVSSANSTFWPFGALSSRVSTLNALMFMLGSTPVQATPGGGFGEPLRPGEKRTITETLLFPFDMEMNGERDAIVVIPPGGRTRSKTRTAPVLLTFSVTGVIATGAAVTGPRVEVMTTSAQELAKLAGDAGVPEWRRLFALSWLAETHPDQAGEALTRQAADGSLSTATRISAILNLGVWRVRDALAPLMRLVQSEPDGAPRLASIAALGDLGDPAASPALRPFLTDANESTARFAIRAIGSLKDAESVAPLTTLLNDGKREPLYGTAASALIAIADANQPVQTVVTGIIGDRKAKERPRSAVISAAASGKAAWAQSAIANVAVNEQDDEDIRVTAVNALRSLGGEASRNALTSVTSSKEKKVREAAASALKQLDSSTSPATSSSASPTAPAASAPAANSPAPPAAESSAAPSTPAAAPPVAAVPGTARPVATPAAPSVATPAAPSPAATPAPVAVAAPVATPAPAPAPTEAPRGTPVAAADPAAARTALEAATRAEGAKDWKTALQQYERARSLDPSMAVFIDASMTRVREQLGGTNQSDALRRARQYDALGRRADAMTWYERALETLPESDPNRDLVKKRLSELKGAQ